MNKVMNKGEKQEEEHVKMRFRANKPDNTRDCCLRHSRGKMRGKKMQIRIRTEAWQMREWNQHTHTLEKEEEEEEEEEEKDRGRDTKRI